MQRRVVRHLQGRAARGRDRVASPGCPGLGERDRAKNRILACQARPTTDCRIKVRLRPENVPAHRPAKFRATLAGTRDLTHDLREFTFKAQGAPGFLPGQVRALLSAGPRRAAHLLDVEHRPRQREWEFIVKRNPAGVGTNTLFDNVPVGFEITLDGPYGLAYLRPDSPRDIVLIGGGSGLAPVLSLARRRHRRAAPRGTQDPGVLRRPRRTRPVRSARAGMPSGLRRTPHLHTGGSETEGFVHERVKKDLGGRFAEFEFYFAGPPPMAEAVQKMLIEARVPYPQVHFDSFY